MKRKFLAWLMTLAMMFNMVMPYAAYADELPVDTDTYVSADGTDFSNDDEFNDVEGEPTVGNPSTDDEQPVTGDSSNDNEEEPVDEQPVDGNDDFTESDGEEVVGEPEQPVDDEPADEEQPVGDEPVDEEQPAEEQPADVPAGEPAAEDEQPATDAVAGLLGAFESLAMTEGLMPVAEEPVGPLATKLVIEKLWWGREARLYTYADGVKGDVNLLADVEPEKEDPNNTYSNIFYTMENIEPGVYWLEQYYNAYEHKDNPLCHGGISIEVKEGVTNTYEICFVSDFKVNNGNWVYGTDYKVEPTIIASNKLARDFEFGEFVKGNLTTPSCLCVRGDTVTVKFIPMGDKTELYKKYAVTTVKIAANSQNADAAVRLLRGYQINVTAPSGSTISAGNLDRYYSFNFSDPIDAKDDGTTATASFDVDDAIGYVYQGSNMHFVRVQHPDGITYWRFGTWNQNGYTVDVSKDDLKIGNTKFKKSTVIKDFSENKYDVGNIYMNINAAGYLSMDKGDGYELNMHRNWQAVDTYWPTSIALPDMHYQVVDFNGNPSDVVEITPDEYNSSQAMMRAKNKGTALVLVTYDAVVHPNSMAKDDNEEVVFSATWPELTGVFVVSVGEDGTDIEANMTLPRYRTAESGSTPRGAAIDAEHDIIFYTDKNGAEYSFTPEEGTTVTVARSTIKNGAMVFNGFTSDGVTVDSETGKVTVGGMKSGRHIIRVEKDGVANYQVITTWETTTKVTHKNGQEVTANNPAAAGERVTIQFTNLLNPMERLAGIYNCTPDIYMVDADGNSYHNNKQVLGGTYDFPYDSGQQALKLTIPYDAAANELVLTGGTIKLVGFKDCPGGHRVYRYGDVESAGMSADANTEAAVLPGVTIPVKPAEYLDGQLTFKMGGATVEAGNLTVTMTDEKGKVITINEDGSFHAVAGKYSYEIKGAGVQYTTGTLTLSDKATSFTVNLAASSENAWDGTTLTMPRYEGQTDEDEVVDDGTIDKTKTYLVGNGNELAWVSSWVSAGYNNRYDQNTTITIKLTADIDLANYPWNAAVTTARNKRSIVLNADGHKITGLDATKGLFATVSSAKIYDLTLSGVVNGTTDNVGGFVGQVAGGEIVNCCNEVAVSSGANNVGGFVGYNSGALTIKNSVNKANITGATYVGGIVGYTANNTNYVYHNISGCYNTGKISGTKAGGISGRVYATRQYKGYGIDNSYSVGYAEQGIVGEWDGKYTNIINCAYLKIDGVTDEAGIAMTADELKGFAPAGTELKATCNGYPALSWESGVSFHNAVEGDVVAPTCTEMGYTMMTCSECNTTYKSNFVAALGHVWDDHAAGDDCASENVKCVVTPSTCTEKGKIVRTCLHAGCTDTITEDVPLKAHTKGEAVENGEHLTYTLYKCADCGQPVYKEYNIAVYEAMDLSDSGISGLTVGDSKWGYNAEQGRMECVHGTSADGSDTTFDMTFTIDHSAIIYLEYGLTKQGVDDGIFTLNKQGDETKLLNKTLTNTTSGSYQGVLEAGTYTLTGKLDWYASKEVANFWGPPTLKYGNDADTAYIKNVTVLAYDADDKADTEMAKVNAVISKINDIKSVSSINLSDLSKRVEVNDARKAYDKLGDSLQKLVTNYSNLVGYEENIKKLEALNEEYKKNPDAVVPAGKIKVTFRLIGSTLTTDDVGVDYDEDGWPDGAHGAEYQTWIKTTSYTVDKDSTAADVFRLALDDSGLNYSLSSSSYINSISAPAVYGGYALKDRTNGDRSGWMYSVNGIHVQKMMGAQTLKNGDKIIVHYINDYYWEDSQWYGGSPYGSSKTWDTWLNAKDVVPGGSESTNGGGGGSTVVSTEVNPIINVNEKGEAKANLSTSEINVIVQEAKDAGASQIVVEPKINGDATTVTVTMPVAAAKSVANNAEADLLIKTDIADVTVSRDDLSGLNSTGSFSVSVAKNSNGTVDVSVIVGGKNAQLKDATVSVGKQGAAATDVLVMVKADGTEQVIKKSVPGENCVIASIDGSCTVKLVRVDVAFNDTLKHWGKSAADFVAARGIFNGTAANTFAPNDKMNRAMVATVLWRLEGELATGGKYGFKDSVEDWAKTAVIWAVEQEIVGGDEMGNYNGGDAVTREELAAMLYRYAKAAGLDTTQGGMAVREFADWEQTADWARAAMQWAVNVGLIKGNDDGTINPTGTATRAEVATVIVRLLAK